MCVCVTAEEAVRQQGRDIMTAPLVVLSRLYRGPLINLAPTWPLALLYLWPSTHHCAHTRCIGKRYWYKGKHITDKDTDALCMRRHTPNGTCMCANIMGVMNMHIYISCSNYRLQIQAFRCTRRNIHKQRKHSILSFFFCAKRLFTHILSNTHKQILHLSLWGIHKWIVDESFSL